MIRGVVLRVEASGKGCRRPAWKKGKRKVGPRNWLEGTVMPSQGAQEPG